MNFAAYTYKDKINYCYILKFHLEQPSTAQTAFES